MSLATALGLIQGVQQLQTHYVAKQAVGFGSRAKYNRGTPGTGFYINAATGLTLASVAKDAAARSQLGSAPTPFASLSEALSLLAAPPTLLAFETPRVIYVAAGTYTVGPAIIRRSLTFILEPGAVITDQVKIESSDVSTHSSTAGITVQFIVLGNSRPALPAGVDIAIDGAATRAVTLFLQGINGTEVTGETGINGAVYLDNSDAEVHADSMVLVAFKSTFGATTAISLEASSVQAYECAFTRPLTVTCNGTDECRLYACRMSNPGGTWTGGTLLIDGSTNYDWTAGGWVKNNPGGAAPTLMV